MKSRITALAATLGLSAKEFSKVIGCSPSWAGNITKSIGSEVILSILDHYPNVNLYWLIKGEGEMFIPSENENKIILSDKDAFYTMLSDIRRDNSELRKENAELRQQITKLTDKNAALLAENLQLKVKQASAKTD